MEIEYPTRCKIVNVTGNRNKSHIEKVGLAEEIEGYVRITLDDGTIIWDYECWWEPLI